MRRQKVVIEIFQGLPEIVSQPENVDVEIIDYDVDGIDEEEFCKDRSCSRRRHIHRYD